MSTNSSRKPFIKKFSQDGFFYVYDVNTNQIVEVENPVYDIIDDYEDGNATFIESKYKGTYSISELRRTIKKIENAREKYGLFSDFRPKKVTMGLRRPDEIKKFHREVGMKQLLLEITGVCNMNCCYCPTSGKYSNSTRLPREMSKKTCKKAVDLFCENSFDTEKPFISFYGGEPLLRFDLIKETVAYVNGTYGRNKYGFNITTNGTLLTKEMIDFFIENDFYIMLSIDGPEKINDRYRIFKNGKGTFNRIMKSLEFLRECDRDYYSRNVSISSVLVPPFDNIDDLVHFFSSDETLDEIRTGGRIRSSLVDTGETSFIEHFGLEESMEGFKYVSDVFIERLKESILHKNIHNLTIEKNVIFSILQNLARRQIKRLYDYAQPLGACHIGRRRVFVHTNGDFYVCERCGNDYKIGSIDSGFDYEVIAHYYRKLEEVFLNCKDCWAISHCDRCWAQIGNLDEFHGKNREKFCSSKKKIIEIAFKAYTELLRKDPDCFKVFDDETKD